MPEDIITYVCSDLSAHAPQAEAGLRDQACDRILGRYIQQEDLDRMRDDPDDLLACLRVSLLHSTTSSSRKRRTS